MSIYIKNDDITTLNSNLSDIGNYAYTYSKTTTTANEDYWTVEESGVLSLYANVRPNNSNQSGYIQVTLGTSTTSLVNMMGFSRATGHLLLNVTKGDKILIGSGMFNNIALTDSTHPGAIFSITSNLKLSQPS